MTAWMLGLLLKGAAVVLIAFLYYVFVYKGSHFLGRFIPDGKIKEALFRERGDGGTTGTRDLQKRP